MADFDEFYAAHYGSLTTQLYAYLGDRQEAQDVVQEAFCRAYARWSSVRDYDDPVAWVRRVAWNLATSHVRRLSVATAFRRRQRVEHEPPPGPDRVSLVAALRELPARHRRAPGAALPRRPAGRRDRADHGRHRGGRPGLAAPRPDRAGRETRRRRGDRRPHAGQGQES